MSEQPVVINPSVTPAQIKTAVRYVLTFAGPFLPKLLAPILTPEAQAILNSDEFANVASVASGVVVGVIMWAWGAIDTLTHKRQLVAAANAAPNTKFVVQKPGDVK